MSTAYQLPQDSTATETEISESWKPLEEAGEDIEMSLAEVAATKASSDKEVPENSTEEIAMASVEEEASKALAEDETSKTLAEEEVSNTLPGEETSKATTEEEAPKASTDEETPKASTEEETPKASTEADSPVAAMEERHNRTSFLLNGLTIRNKVFSFGTILSQPCHIAKLRPTFDEVDVNGITYKAGIRSNDVLLAVNRVNIEQLTLAWLAGAITKLKSFYFVLKRKSKWKKHYIHVAFNVYEGEGYVDINRMAFYFGVPREGDYYFPLIIERLPLQGVYYFEGPPVDVRMLVTTDGVDQHWLNSDIPGRFVKFTPTEVFLRMFTYVNTGAPGGESIAVVLSPTTDNYKWCMAADTTNRLYIVEKGNLGTSYDSLDQRFFFKDTRNSSDVTLQSTQRTGFFITVNQTNWHGDMKVKEDGVQEMTQLTSPIVIEPESEAEY